MPASDKPDAKCKLCARFENRITCVGRVAGYWLIIVLFNEWGRDDVDDYPLHSADTQRASSASLRV